jgi:hypothetical protein
MTGERSYDIEHSCQPLQVRFTQMPSAYSFTPTEKFVLALALILSLSNALGVYPLPTHYIEEIRALAQYPGPEQRTPQEIDQLFQSLMRERWAWWLLTLCALAGTLATAISVLCRFRYWPVIALLVSGYVLAITVPPIFRLSGGFLDLLIDFVKVIRAKPLDAMYGLWMFLFFPMLNGALALLALLAILKSARRRAA